MRTGGGLGARLALFRCRLVDRNAGKPFPYRRFERLRPLEGKVVARVVEQGEGCGGVRVECAELARVAGDAVLASQDERDWSVVYERRVLVAERIALLSELRELGVVCRREIQQTSVDVACHCLPGGSEGGREVIAELC
jgi:hypothetical protein